MIKCTALKAAERLQIIHLKYVIEASRGCLDKISQIRGFKRTAPLSKYEIEILERFTELISLTFGVSYETESLLLVSELAVIRDLFSEIKKSVQVLKNKGDIMLECEEQDSDFYIQYALYSLYNH